MFGVPGYMFIGFTSRPSSMHSGKKIAPLHISQQYTCMNCVNCVSVVQNIFYQVGVV